MSAHSRYVKINNQTASAEFSVPVGAKKIWVDVSRQGEDKPVLRHTNTSLTGDKASFAWDNNIRNLGAGWYWLDLVVNDCCCGVYPLLIEPWCGTSFLGSTERMSVLCPDGDCTQETLPLTRMECVQPVAPPSSVCKPSVCPSPLNEPYEYKPAVEIP